MIERTPPTTNAQPAGQVVGEIGALRVPASKKALDVLEARAILQVEERAAVSIDGGHVGSSGELVMLVRLVQSYLKPELPEVRCLDLAHRGMNRVRVALRSDFGLRQERESRIQSQHDADANVGCEPADPAALQLVDLGRGESRFGRESGLSPAPADPLGACFAAEFGSFERQGRGDPQRRF